MYAIMFKIDRFLSKTKERIKIKVTWDSNFRTNINKMYLFEKKYHLTSRRKRDKKIKEKI